MAGNEESSDEDEISRIRLPRANDVLCGRGGHGTSHPGNLGFRMLVEKYKPKFQSAPRSEKSKIATAVVMAWRKQNPPGRFLSLSSESRGGYNLWHDIGDKLATRKANQGLREKGPNPGHLGIAPPPPPSAAAAPSSDISSVAAVATTNVPLVQGYPSAVAPHYSAMLSPALAASATNIPLTQGYPSGASTPAVAGVVAIPRGPQTSAGLGMHHKAPSATTSSSKAATAPNFPLTHGYHSAAAAPAALSSASAAIATDIQSAQHSSAGMHKKPEARGAKGSSSGRGNAKQQIADTANRQARRGKGGQAKQSIHKQHQQERVDMDGNVHRRVQDAEQQIQQIQFQVAQQAMQIQALQALQMHQHRQQLQQVPQYPQNLQQQPPSHPSQSMQQQPPTQSQQAVPVQQQPVQERPQSSLLRHQLEMFNASHQQSVNANGDATAYSSGASSDSPAPVSTSTGRGAASSSSEPYGEPNTGSSSGQEAQSSSSSSSEPCADIGAPVDTDEYQALDRASFPPAAKLTKHAFSSSDEDRSRNNTFDGVDGESSDENRSGDDDRDVPSKSKARDDNLSDTESNKSGSMEDGGESGGSISGGAGSSGGEADRSSSSSSDEQQRRKHKPSKMSKRQGTRLPRPNSEVSHG